MVSLTQFRMNVFSFFKVMSSSHMVLEVVHQKKVYDVTITLTDKKPNLTRPKKVVAPQIIQVNTEICPDCGTLAFNGICMNRQCTRSKGSLGQVEVPTLPQQSSEAR